MPETSPQINGSLLVYLCGGKENRLVVFKVKQIENAGESGGSLLHLNDGSTLQTDHSVAELAGLGGHIGYLAKQALEGG